ncbi:MAG: helix-turn-helix transcriptional regulator [Lachnospiraceae bacterium]|nr:helix-turn-helix transcriptional regulator [Lachnospiraceae bacterium]
MLNETTFAMLKQIAAGLARQFGPNCEIVIHSLNNNPLESSIFYIENGSVTNRKVGDGPSHIVLEALKHDHASLSDKLNYLTKTHDGRILKSSTMYIRDEAGVLSAIFAINFDITHLLALETSVHSLIATDEPDSVSEPEQIPLNVNELLDQLIDQSIALVGKPVALMTKDDKVKAVKFLNDSGAFLITKSGNKVSEQFGISKYTLYSYIDAASRID